MFRPLAFEYESDEIACRVEDQLLIGDEIMIAPVYEQNALGRVVYIPENMMLVRFRNGEVIKGDVYHKGFHFIEVALDEVILFVKENRKLILSKGGMRVTDVDFENVDVISFGESVKPYEYYTDDGEVKDYSEKYIRVI